MRNFNQASQILCIPSPLAIIKAKGSRTYLVNASQCNTHSLYKTKQGTNMGKKSRTHDRGKETSANNRKFVVVVLTCHFPSQSPWSTRSMFLPGMMRLNRKMASLLVVGSNKAAAAKILLISVINVDATSRVASESFAKQFKQNCDSAGNGRNSDATTHRHTMTRLPMPDASSCNFTGRSCKDNCCS